MPVKLEILQQLNADDRRDIAKILAETKDQVATQYSIDAVETQLASGSYWLFAGRFNDRIVGIVLAKHQQEPSVLTSSTQLIFAGVRRLTQRRGVMHQLMILIERWSNQQSCSLVIDYPPQDLQAALLNRHFTQHHNSWIYRPS